MNELRWWYLLLVPVAGCEPCTDTATPPPCELGGSTYAKPAHYEFLPANWACDLEEGEVAIAEILHVDREAFQTHYSDIISATDATADSQLTTHMMGPVKSLWEGTLANVEVRFDFVDNGGAKTFADMESIISVQAGVAPPGASMHQNTGVVRGLINPPPRAA